MKKIFFAVSLLFVGTSVTNSKGLKFEDRAGTKFYNLEENDIDGQN